MPSLLEKLLILKTVGIFMETPDDALAEIAPLLEEITVKAGESIFVKGDPGDSMYMIVDGKVRVHDGEMTLNFLGKRDVFGEMAALDPEPRSASVTAEEDTLLFRLEQEAFYKLMEQRIEVTQGVIRVLCQHLRARMRDLREDFTYLQQFARVTAAAAAVEAGIFEPESLDEVALRTDALGQLARVFQRMTREVQAREQRLKAQLQQLTIEIDQFRKEKQVAEITESDYFKQVQQAARALRKRSGKSDDA